MLNLTLSFLHSSSDNVLSDYAIGACVATLTACAQTCSLLRRFIVWTCWSDFAWLRMLVVHTESASLIDLSLKFFHPRILSLFLVHSQHLSFVTSFTPPSIPVLQSSHVTVWQSQSYCLTHFWYCRFGAWLSFTWLATHYHSTSGCCISVHERMYVLHTITASTCTSELHVYSP